MGFLENQWETSASHPGKIKYQPFAAGGGLHLVLTVRAPWFASIRPGDGQENSAARRVWHNVSPPSRGREPEHKCSHLGGGSLPPRFFHLKQTWTQTTRPARTGGGKILVPNKTIKQHPLSMYWTPRVPTVKPVLARQDSRNQGQEFQWDGQDFPIKQTRK